MAYMLFDQRVLSEGWFVIFTDVTLADEDPNSILNDSANRAIQGNVAMQLVPPCGQI